MKRLIADTGPILHLHEAGALSLLPLMGEILLPPQVLAELRIHAPALWPDSLPDWVKLPAMSRKAQQQGSQWRQAGLLHGGEAEALALALELRPSWFLTDDAAARLMAESLGQEVHGSLGIVLWAAATRLIEKTGAETCLAALEKSSLWMSPRVRMEARAALAKMFATS